MVVSVDERLASVHLEAYHFLLQMDARQRSEGMQLALGAMRPQLPVTGSAQMEGAKASDLLALAVEALTTKAIALAGKYPAHAWLHYLRSMPIEAFGGGEFRIEGSIHGRRRIVEALSSIGAADRSSPIPAWAIPTPYVLRFIFASRAVENAQVLHRHATKGVPLLFHSDAWPSTVESDRRTKALRVHDERLQKANPINWLSGTIGTAADIESGGTIINTLLMLEPRPYESYEHASDTPLQFGGVPVYDWSFRLTRVTLRIPVLMKGYSWASKDLPYRLMLQHCLAPLLRSNVEAQAYLSRFGYVTMSRAVLAGGLAALQATDAADEFGALFPDVRITSIDPQDIIDSCLATPSPGRWMMGAGLRVAPDDDLVFDPVTNAAAAVYALSPESPGGPAANVRADDLEKITQSMIDASPWAPPGPMRAFVGRTLRIPDGSNLTDLDSFAFNDGVGIFIDCKSLALPGAFQGEFRATRGTRTTLERAVAKWQTIVESLQRFPRGKNYDFSAVQRFVPLVLTTAPHFVFFDLLEPRVLDGLRPVSAFSELQEFLLA